ncbi:MAG: hypothetical protein DHS20C18_52920 [Saprospiraceae bacterium]|nr:MAG: hypothetical protein DHS20C18_52920 [Saprospiraceae bacterium]
MRKVILNLAISLDGLIEGPKGEFDWCFTDQDYGMPEFLAGIDTIFYGRKSYELMVRMGEKAFASNKQYVFSNTLKQVEPGWHLINSDISSKVKEILSQHGKDIWLFGGTSLVTTFMKEGWIDEYLLSIHPLLLGQGKPLFQDLNERVHLKLVDTIPYSSGLVQLRYRSLEK